MELGLQMFNCSEKRGICSVLAVVALLKPARCVRANWLTGGGVCNPDLLKQHSGLILYSVCSLSDVISGPATDDLTPV